MTDNDIRTRLNISLAGADYVLSEVISVIKRPRAILVRGGSGCDSIRSQVWTRTSNQSMDLIAHSRRGVLDFGSWRISKDETQSVPLLRSWQEWRPTRIRLIGCNTAYTSEGIAAMDHLQKAAGVPVYGSVSPVYVENFDEHGLKEAANVLMISVDGLKRREKASIRPADAIDEWYGRLPTGQTSAVKPDDLLSYSESDVDERHARMGTASEYVSADKFADLLDWKSVPKAAPGLLALPDYETLAPASHGRVFRVSHFFDNALARVYTKHHPEGLLLRNQPGAG